MLISCQKTTFTKTKQVGLKTTKKYKSLEEKLINLVIDSASDIEQDEAKNMGITVIPMEVVFGDEVFLDGVDLSHKRFFEKLIESNELPKTSQINEFRFDQEFQRLTQNGDQVVVITLSSKLSGTYNNAFKAGSVL